MPGLLLINAASVRARRREGAEATRNDATAVLRCAHNKVNLALIDALAPEMNERLSLRRESYIS